MRRITPFLWFDNNANEAVDFYVSVFPNSRRIGVADRPPGTPGPPEDTPLTVEFELDGQPFIALNGGPHFTFTPAVSFVVHCNDQTEVDHYWDSLLAGGAAQQCGWLTDRFGVTWQIVPTVLGDLLGAPDRDAAERTMHAMLGMIKLDIAGLQAAFHGA